MGIALTTFSALSSPLRTLSRWLQPAIHVQSAAENSLDRVDEAQCNAPSPGAQSAAQPATPRPPQPPGSGAFRPVRGNWPFTVSPPPPAQPSIIPTPQTAAGRCTDSSTLVGRGARRPLRTRIRSSRGTVDAGRSDIFLQCNAGRMVISGRMADVCAELERMAACEAGLASH